MSHLIRATNIEVVKSAKHVKINNEALNNILQLEGNGLSGDFASELSKIQWDACDWHYAEDTLVAGPNTAQYIFVMDALNFCFWPCPGLEYEHLAKGLKAALLADPHAFSAENLKQVSQDTLNQWIPGWNIPQMEERVARIREIGEILADEFDGEVVNLIKKANKSAVKLVTLVTRYFPGFRDASVYNGRLVHFYKRAQIFVADIWGAYGRQNDASHPFYFYDMDQLTMFADYRIPQILRHVGILEYSENLASRIDNFEIIPFGCDEESEIRACTVIAVEELRAKILEKTGQNLTSVEIDWLLWNWGEQVKDSIKPHHRTLTIFY